MLQIELPNVHRVRRKLSNGNVREHHYAWRGGPKFWSSDSPTRKNSADYRHMLFEAEQAYRTASPGVAGNKAAETVEGIVRAYLESAAYLNVRGRTQQDYRLWLSRIEASFGEDEIELFQYRQSKGEVETWLRQWRHSACQHDYALSVLLVLLNWAVEGGKIKEHFCSQIARLYKAKRSEIIWTDGELKVFCDNAPAWVARILRLACETGLRPADLVALRRSECSGKVITLVTRKRGTIAKIPITPKLQELFDDLPEGQELVLVGERGAPISSVMASRAVTQWRNIINALAEEHGEAPKLKQNLRLYDARGTAATRLVNAGMPVNMLANIMGWKKRYAANMLDIYVADADFEADAALELLERAESAKVEKERKRFCKQPRGAEGENYASA